VSRAAVLAGLAFVVAGCAGDVDRDVHVRGGGDDAPPAYGDTLVQALLGNISGLIPPLTSDGPSRAVAGLLYNGLVRLDRDLEFVGDLAESWHFTPDCRELTFTLRRDVRWHDGAPFDADDVVFTYETMVDPRTPSAYKDDFVAIASIDAPDPYTVRVRYRKPYAKALQSWAHAILPRHRLEPYVREGRLREAPQNWHEPVGTGPYRLAELRAGQKIELRANPDYFAGRPHISRIVYRVIPSQATIFLELRARGLDLASLTALQYTRQTDYPAFRKAYNKFRYPGSVYTYLGFNLRDPRFADVRVRRAFAHAIDQQELIDGVVLGLGQPATGPYQPGTWVYNPDVARYPYDPDRARALLAQAGWRAREGDGVLVRDGRPFRFELLTNQGNEERRKVAEMVQAALRQIGVAVEIRTLEWAALLNEYVRKRRFDALILGWGIGVDPDQYLIWHSSKTGPDDLNAISYANREVDALLEKGRSTCRQSDRKRHYDRLQEILADELPVVFLYFRDALPVVASRVHGIDPGPGGIDHNLPEWFVPAHLQRYTAE
jgi:peptide/nickel transport system substrate-binding protein